MQDCIQKLCPRVFTFHIQGFITIVEFVDIDGYVSVGDG